MVAKSKSTPQEHAFIYSEAKTNFLSHGLKEEKPPPPKKPSSKQINWFPAISPAFAPM